jgi:hypothetical protein
VAGVDWGLRGNRFYKGYRVFVEKASNHYKKASIPLKIYLKSLAILGKTSISLIIIEIFIK